MGLTTVDRSTATSGGVHIGEIRVLMVVLHLIQASDHPLSHTRLGIRRGADAVKLQP